MTVKQLKNRLKAAFGLLRLLCVCYLVYYMFTTDGLSLFYKKLAIVSVVVAFSTTLLLVVLSARDTFEDE